MTNLVAVQTTDICLPVAISRSENRLVAQIAPNPNKGQFRITVADPAQLQLTDALGRLVAQQTIAAGTTSIDTQSLTNGIYFLYLKDNQGRKALEKIMVQQ